MFFFGGRISGEAKEVRCTVSSSFPLLQLFPFPQFTHVVENTDILSRIRAHYQSGRGTSR